MTVKVKKKIEFGLHDISACLLPFLEEGFPLSETNVQKLQVIVELEAKLYRRFLLENKAKVAARLRPYFTEKKSDVNEPRDMVSTIGLSGAALALANHSVDGKILGFEGLTPLLAPWYKEKKWTAENYYLARAAGMGVGFTKWWSFLRANGRDFSMIKEFLSIRPGIEKYVYEIEDSISSPEFSRGYDYVKYFDWSIVDPLLISTVMIEQENYKATYNSLRGKKPLDDGQLDNRYFWEDFAPTYHFDPGYDALAPIYDEETLKKVIESLGPQNSFKATGWGGQTFFGTKLEHASHNHVLELLKNISDLKGLGDTLAAKELEANNLSLFNEWTDSQSLSMRELVCSDLKSGTSGVKIISKIKDQEKIQELKTIFGNLKKYQDFEDLASLNCQKIAKEALKNKTTAKILAQIENFKLPTAGEKAFIEYAYQAERRWWGSRAGAEPIYSKTLFEKYKKDYKGYYLSFIEDYFDNDGDSSFDKYDFDRFSKWFPRGNLSKICSSTREKYKQKVDELCKKP